MGVSGASLPAGVALVALTADGAALARRLAPELSAAKVHGLSGRVVDADVTFDDVGRHLAGLFAAGTAIAGICAAGS